MLKWYNVLFENKVNAKEVVNLKIERLHGMGLRIRQCKQFLKSIDDYDSTGT